MYIDHDMVFLFWSCEWSRAVGSHALRNVKGNMAKKITINDVAMAAGCSKATVSYVINRNRPISDAIRAKVLAAIEQLGYTPSCHRGVASRNEVVILDSFDQSVFRPNRVVNIFAAMIFDSGFIPRIYRFRDRDFNSLRTVMLGIDDDRRVAGIISLIPSVESMDILKYSGEIPAIIYIRDECMLSPVRLNFERRMSLALNYLAEYGHRKFILLIDANTKSSPVVVKHKNSLDAYRLKNGDHIEYRIVPIDEGGDTKNNFARIDEALRGGCTAVISMSGTLSAFFYIYCYERKINIPVDLSVLSFGDDGFAETAIPPLTSVDNPSEALVEFTVNALLEKIQNRKPREITLQPVLHIRSSVGEVSTRTR